MLFDKFADLHDCRHSPEIKGGWLQKMLRFTCSRQLYTYFYSDNTVCRKCETFIYPPRQYCSPILTVAYMFISALMFFAAIQVAKLLVCVGPLKLLCLLVCLCIAFVFPRIAERITTAIIFSSFPWITADKKQRECYEKQEIMHRRAKWHIRIALLSYYNVPWLLPFLTLIPSVAIMVLSGSKRKWKTLALSFLVAIISFLIIMYEQLSWINFWSGGKIYLSGIAALIYMYAGESLRIKTYSN